jgi:hypothetical protein
MNEAEMEKRSLEATEDLKNLLSEWQKKHRVKGGCVAEILKILIPYYGEGNETEETIKGGAAAKSHLG